MSQVGIDLMKLCETDRFEDQAGFQYIITAQCYFMKYVETGALRTKMGIEVANWIYMNIFCHYCVTDIHISDRGTEFCNMVSKDLCKKCGMRHHIMMLYHPQASGMIERCNHTTSEMILKMISAERKQKDWVNYLPTVALALHSSMYHIINYEPLMHLIGHKPKLPSECTQYEEDVLKNPDFTEEEIELLSQTVTEENFHNLVEMRDLVFASADANIKKGQKRQKENYNLRNERPVGIDIGDIVLKEKQKDISCKGGKLHDRYNVATYTVIKIMQNGNALLHSNKSNEVLTTPCPLKHLKKYVKREVEMPTTSMSTSATKMTTAGMPKSMMTRTTPGMDASTDARTDARKEDVPSKKRLHFKIDMTSSLTPSLTSSSDVSVTYSMTVINNGIDDLEFMDDILDVTGKSVLQDKVESLDSDDEFKVEVWSVSNAQNCPF